MNRPPITKTSKPAAHKPTPSPPSRSPAFDPALDQEATKILDGASDTPTPAEDVDESAPETRDLCRPHRPTDVAYQFSFRTLHPLMDAAPRALLDAAVAGGRLRIACTPLVEVGLTYVADLRFLQVWRLLETCIGDLSAVVALAPGEQTTLSIKQTQRTSFTRQEVDSSESMTSLENTQIDKDVLNVARSTTKANQWRVDSTASISLGEVGSLSVSAGYSESTSNTTSRALERITEATQKSAQQLKNLQKTEVTQTHEVTEEAFARRRIKNPYRDRSLMLNVFDLYKRFEVITGLAEIRPSLALEIPSMRFDREFVLENADFLQAELLDSSVIEELRAALQTVQRPMDAVDETDTRRLATNALQYLFFEPYVVGDGTVHVNWSIDESLNGMGNALDDAVGNHLGVEFTTLVFFKRFYERMPVAERERWAIRIAVTLAESIGPGWTAGDQGHIANVLDRHNPTEVMRRLSGFLALVDKIIKPLLTAPEDARMARDSSERAEFVIARVVKHLGCYQDYYVQRWLEYVYRRSDRLTLIRLLHDVLSATGRLDLLRNFDPAEAFLEGNRFIVPARKRVVLDDSVKWGERLRGNSGFESGLPAPRRTIAVVPTDGVHIEPRAGGCVLDELPPAAVNVSTKLEISAQGEDTTESAADDTETDAETDG
jgi:hypothetical protein